MPVYLLKIDTTDSLDPYVHLRKHNSFTLRDKGVGTESSVVRLQLKHLDTGIFMLRSLYSSVFIQAYVRAWMANVSRITGETVIHSLEEVIGTDVIGGDVNTKDSTPVGMVMSRVHKAHSKEQQTLKNMGGTSVVTKKNTSSQ